MEQGTSLQSVCAGCGEAPGSWLKLFLAFPLCHWQLLDEVAWHGPAIPLPSAGVERWLQKRISKGARTKHRWQGTSAQEVTHLQHGTAFCLSVLPVSKQ